MSLLRSGSSQKDNCKSFHVRVKRLMRLLMAMMMMMMAFDHPCHFPQSFIVFRFIDFHIHYV
jgi:hypothetical protein